MNARPRIGFLGAGWIGRSRMEAICATGVVDAVAVADPDPACLDACAAIAPAAARFATPDELMTLDLDGLVIATPSALHAGQAIAALERGWAVFCQKPLGRSAEETAAVLAAARAADRLLAIDLSYRHTSAMQDARALIRAGEIGDVFAADLRFHNAFSPSRGWCRDPALAGGGCVIDLGIHLADLALWALDFPEVGAVQASLYAKGRRIAAGEIEDFALATIALASCRTVRMACSWDFHVGAEADIAAIFHGTQGGLAFRNVDGSFYHFALDRFEGSRSRRIGPDGPDAWNGRAAAAWALRLARDPRYDTAADRILDSARILDSIYAAAQP